MQALLVLPFHLEQAMGYSGRSAGLLLAPWPAATTVTAILAGRLSERCSVGVLGGLGLVMFASGDRNRRVSQGPTRCEVIFTYDKKKLYE